MPNEWLLITRGSRSQAVRPLSCLPKKDKFVPEIQWRRAVALLRNERCIQTNEPQ